MRLLPMGSGVQKKDRRPGFPGRAASNDMVSRNFVVSGQLDLFSHFLRKYRQSILDLEPLDLPVTQVPAHFHELPPSRVQISELHIPVRVVRELLGDTAHVSPPGWP